MAIERDGARRADPRARRHGPADPRHLRRDDRLRPRPPRPDRRARPPQRLRSPARRASRPTCGSRGSGRSRCARSSSARPGSRSAATGVEVLCEWEGHPVAVREGTVLACSFHPELADDPRMHALLMAMATGAHERRAAAARPQRQRGGKAMRDPRVENLARILVEHSTGIKQGDTCAIEGAGRGRAAGPRRLRARARRRRPPDREHDLDGADGDLLRARQRRADRVDLADAALDRRGGRRPDPADGLGEHARALAASTPRGRRCARRRCRR